MRNSISHGFSFLEVLVAMTILSICLIVLMENQGRSMDLVARAKSLDQAVTLATAKMIELKQLVKEKGLYMLRDEETGEFDPTKYSGYQWKYRKVKVPMPDLMSLLSSAGNKGGEEEKSPATKDAMMGGFLNQISKVWGESLQELHVEVFWQDGTRQRNVELVTHLVAQNAISQFQGAIGAATGGINR